MTSSKFYPGYLEATHRELRVGMRVLVSFGLCDVRELLAPDARQWPGVRVGRGGRYDDVRMPAAQSWLVEASTKGGAR